MLTYFLDLSLLFRTVKFNDGLAFAAFLTTHARPFLHPQLRAGHLKKGKHEEKAINGHQNSFKEKHELY